MWVQTAKTVIVGTKDAITYLYDHKAQIATAIGIVAAYMAGSKLQGK